MILSRLIWSRGFFNLSMLAISVMRDSTRISLLASRPCLHLLDFVHKRVGHAVSVDLAPVVVIPVGKDPG